MKKVYSISFRNGSKEELLPNFRPEFPYICTCAELDKYNGRFVPWHWHKEIELFYMEKGVLEYYTPSGKTIFPEGSGGFINSNVLHMTKPHEGARDTTQLEHIFDISLISGPQGSLIEQKYVNPLITAPQIEVIGLYPENAAQNVLLQLIQESFQLSEDDSYYEIRLRNILSEIWCQLLHFSEPLREETGSNNKANDKIKRMMIYIHEHFPQKLTTVDIAVSAYISERECFRVFRDCLHTTPIEYLNGYRLQKSCHMLGESKETITNISLSCGFGSSSYFGKIFRLHKGCTPIEYRNRWQNNDTFWQ